MIEKHLGKFKRKIEIAVIGLAIVVVVLGVCSFLQFTKPFAVSEDGVKVEKPWVVKIGSEETFVVADQKDGKEIVEGIKNSYNTENTKADSTTVSPEITVVEKELKRGDETPKITETKDAVAKVVEANKTEEPLVAVTTTEEVAKTEAIDYKTKYEKSNKLYTGEEKIVTKGKKGKKTIVSQVTKTNGQVVAKEVVSSKVEQKPTAKVVQQGTKTVTASNGNAAISGGEAAPVSRGGAAMGRGSGKDVVNYALQFVGNPYVYGGTSLTNGADCSGFTMSVYAKFGVSLPHSSSAQRSCGRGVSYSEAKPGDLICYEGHVAIYVGNGQIVHASTPSSGIKVSSATYKNILTVRRIIE